jgi:hypothetical protein
MRSALASVEISKGVVNSASSSTSILTTTASVAAAFPDSNVRFAKSEIPAAVALAADTVNRSASRAKDVVLVAITFAIFSKSGVKVMEDLGKSLELRRQCYL